MSRRTALALLGPALGLVAWRAAAALRRRAERYVLFDRPQSNNCARVRLWIYLRGLEARFDVRATSHAAQARDAFRALNPAAKIPLLVILDGAGDGGAARGDAETTAARGGAALSEAAVILEYLEERHASPWRRALVPADALARARMRLVVRVHDIYLASPNAHAARPAGLNVHTMGALFIDPPDPSRPDARALDRPTRAAKLAEVWRQLDALEVRENVPFPPRNVPSLTAGSRRARGLLRRAVLRRRPADPRRPNRVPDVRALLGAVVDEAEAPLSHLLSLRFVYFEFYLRKVFGWPDARRGRRG